MRSLLLQAWRNFARNLQRYRVLLLALVLISAILTVVLGSLLGLRGSLREKASRYFAGDVAVVAYIGLPWSIIDHPDQVLEAIKELPEQGIPITTWSRRSTYYVPENTELFFAGDSMPQRRLVGVEWELERPVLESFDFVSGGVPESGDEEGVLISTATADQLGIRVGDQLLISILSERGRVNTAHFAVRGIYAESSFFGFTTYLPRIALNRLREVPDSVVNEMGVYLRDPMLDEAQAARMLAEEIGERLPSFGQITSREEYDHLANVGHPQLTYGTVTLGVQLAEINDLLGAITLIAGAIMALFLGITVIGVSNTFTMVVWERTKEIGTLRALGMQRPRTAALFLLEAAILGFSGVLIGLLIGVALLSGVREWMSFPPNALTSLFLTQGRLAWELPVWGVAIIAGLSMLASLIGSLRAAVRASRLNPVEALQRK